MNTTFTVDCVNKIKGEGWDQFETSIFSDEYRKAHELLLQILKANEILETRNALEKFCDENQIVNVISFLGERGMGKSSAMLSFAYYLKNYSGSEIPEKHSFYLKKKDEIYFSVLSKVDVAMMMQGEKLFDIILAKMWNEYMEAAERQVPDYDYVWREVASQFNEVKNAYARYIAVLKNDDKATVITKYTELSDLSKSLTLRKSFEKLVDLYLKCKKNMKSEAYLVIPIDDLDMVMDNVHDKLEEVRFLLSVPKVIVLLTADVNRMALILNGQFSRHSLCSKNVIEVEKESMRGYVANYLGKVLPRNMRIYMPTFRGVENEKIFIDLSKYVDEIDFKLRNTRLESDKLQLIFIRRILRIMVYPEKRNYVIRTNNLRNQVNSTYELLVIMRQKEELRYQLAYRWLHKELNVGYIEINLNNCARLVHLLLECPDEYINETLSNFSVEDDYYSENIDIAYGVMLSKMLVMENMWATDIIGKNLVQWIMSLAISNTIIKMPNAVEQVFLRRDIFSSVIPRRKSYTEQSMNVDQGFVLNLVCESDITKELISRDENHLEIFRTFNVLMFYDMSEILVNNILSKEVVPVDTKRVVLRCKSFSRKTSVDNLFYNVIHLDTYWEQYLQLIYDSLFQDQDEVGFDEFKIEFNSFPEKYNEWKKKYNVKYLWDILPVQDVSIMKEIASRIRKLFSNIPNVNQVQSNIEEIIIHEVIEVFKESEKYYNDDLEEDVQFAYAQKLEDLLNIGLYSDTGDKIKNIFQQVDSDKVIY